MFRLVLGRSKSGKTEYVRNYLSALAEQGEKKLLMIVPDQQSFDTEKAFLELLGPQVSMNVKVLGFSRLCDYVFEITAQAPMTYADESVRTLLMSMALEDTRDLLRVYSDKADTLQLLNMMLSVNKEFVRNRVSDDLSELTTLWDNTILHNKIHDAQLVLSAYNALLSSSFSDAENALLTACELLESHKIFEDYYICIDSYLSFTKIELSVIRLLMSQCKELLVTLSDDGTNKKDTIFEISKSTAKKLYSFAKEDGISVSSPIICDYAEYFINEELRHIEKYIFDYTAEPQKLILSEKDSPVSVYNAKNIYDEADYVARKIRELVLTKGYRYSDIAVVCRDVSPYNTILDTTLDKYEISYFMDISGAIHSKPLVKLIRACFDCITSTFQREYVLAILKSGLISGNVSDISMFENYVLTWDISGAKFKDEFTANPRGFANEFTTSDLRALSVVETLRKSVVVPLVEFKDKIKGAKAQEVCKELYSLLINLGVDKRILSLCDEYEKSGELTLSEELVRLWQMFSDTLDRTISVIGNRVVEPKRFAELLDLQFSAQDISFIPRGMDQVTVGDIERLRLSNKKVVFVIGALEGEFPRVATDSGLFTVAEREMLSDAGILSDQYPHKNYLREEYLCYYALTSASDLLYISYPSSSLSGSNSAPSEIVTSVISLFENLREISSFDVPVTHRLWAIKPSFEVYASRFGSEDSVTKALEEYYKGKEEYKDSVNALHNAVTHQNFRINDKNVAEELFVNNFNLSASQVENYYKCAFRYFCDYGMRLQERKLAVVDGREYGNIVHYILENFIKNHTKLQMSDMDDEAISAEIEKYIEEYANLNFGGIEDKSAQLKYLLKRISVNVAELLKHIIKELTQSRFTPEAFEFSIGDDIPKYKLSLPNGRSITVRGKVDRADVMEKDGKKYIRIIDYKSREQVFSLSEVMYGLNLQMLIYLSAIQKNGAEFFDGEVIPAGVLYMLATVSGTSAEFSEEIDKILAKRNDKLCMNGLILNDIDVLEGMERDMKGLYIPVYLNKSSKLMGENNLATLAEMGAIFNRIDELLSDMAMSLSEGDVSAVPIKGTTDGCKYCQYSSICRHKESDAVRYAVKLDRNEILEQLDINDTEEVAEK